MSSSGGASGAGGPFVTTAARGAPDGVAELDANAQVPKVRMPDQSDEYASADGTQPQAFGLAADGVTDAAPGLNAMASSKQLRYGGTLLLKKPLVLKTQQQIEGFGRFASVLKFDPSAFAASVALPAITSITADGTFYTITFASAHGRSVDDVIEIYGAVPDAWNDDFQVITVVSATVLTVKCPLSPPAPTTLPAARTVNALVIFGSAAALVFGTRICNLVIDCSDIPDAIALFGEYGSMNEMSGVSDVLITHATYKGVRMKAAQWQWDSSEVYLQNAPVQATTVGSGSNGVDLNGAAFQNGTGVINIAAGDLAAQRIPWAGAALIAVTGAAGYRPVYYRGVSAGTGPSGQDQLLNVQAAVGVSRVMGTGIAVTISSSIGLDLTVPGGTHGASSTLKLHRTTIVGGAANQLRAAVRVNGGGQCVLDGLHTEKTVTGLLVGDKAASTGLTTIGFSRASGGSAGITILNPADGSTNKHYTFIGTGVDGGYAVIADAPNSVVIPNTDPAIAQYPIPLTAVPPMTIYKQTLAGLTPSAAADTPGAAGTFALDAGKASIMPLFARCQATVIGAETITVDLTANYADGTSSSVLQATTTNTSLFAPQDTQFPNLLKDGTYITSITATVQSTIANSTAQVTVILSGYSA